jgi:hypothetical protein
VTISLCSASAAVAQTNAAAAASAQRTVAAPTPPATSNLVAAARAIEGPPAMDGDVANDPVWGLVQPVSGFTQVAPNEGEPGTEKTEVRVAFTNDTLYVGVICYDRDPTGIIVNDSRRDSSLTDSDSFQMIFDTFRDKQNGFVFGTSPSGQQYDGQVIKEGTGGSGLGGGGSSEGGGGGFNLNWDGAWQVQAKTSDIGWSAEFAIPFRTLRYPSGVTQTWGINFQRLIRRHNETDYWAPLPRQYNLFRVSMAGRLTDLKVPRTAVRNLKVTPYVLGRVRELTATKKTNTDQEAGADLKYSITSGLALDLTYNTDFAQIEVDQQQVNLDRFNLYFPEKRPFFLENAGAFTVNNAGGAVRGDPAQTELFFSRAIGIANGQVVPIVGGARVTGKMGHGYTLGLLNMQTEEVRGLTPANNFSVARIVHDLPNRSTVGALFVNRQATGDLAGTNNHNRTYGTDARIGVGQNAAVQGFLGHTETPGKSGKDYAYNIASEFNFKAWRGTAGWMNSGDNFNPEVGFVRRVGFHRIDSGIFNTTRPKNLWKFQELTPHMTFNRFWNSKGDLQTSYLHQHVQAELKDSTSFGIGFNTRSEGVEQAFKVSGVGVPTGRYDWHEVEFMYNSNRSRPFSYGLRGLVGGYFGGNLHEYGPSVRYRRGEQFSVSVSLTRDDIDLPSGSVVTNLASTRVAYNFSPQLYVQSLIQYNTSAKLWATNLRFGFVQTANTGLFIVYDDTEGIGPSFIPSGAGQRLTIKYSRLFDVLH